MNKERKEHRQQEYRHVCSLCARGLGPRTYQHCEQSTHRAQDRHPLGLSSRLVEVLKAVQSWVRISKRVQTKRQCPVVEMSWMGKRGP